MSDIIAAELYKFRKSSLSKRSLIIAIIFSFFIIISSGQSNEWKQNIENYNTEIEHTTNMTSEQLNDSIQDNALINQWKRNSFYLKNNKRPPSSDTFQGYIGFVLSLKGLGLIFIVFIIIFSVQIGKEYELGTIKYSIISKHSRSEIIIGKYIATVLFSLLFLVLILLFNIILGNFLLNHSDSIFYTFKNGQINQIPILLFIIKNLLLSLFYYWIYLTLGFTLSILFKSSLISLTITLFLSLLGTQLMNLVKLPEKLLITLLPAIVDLTHTENSLSIVEKNNYNIFICSFIIILYGTIFLIIAIHSFKNQDI